MEASQIVDQVYLVQLSIALALSVSVLEICHFQGLHEATYIGVEVAHGVKFQLERR